MNPGWSTGMSPDNDRLEPVEPERRIAPAVALGRRRLLRAGLGAAPVIMTFASGPVSAGLCKTGSAYGSLNPSGARSSATCGGKSPAAWTGTAHGQWPCSANALFQTYFSPALAGTNVTLKLVVDPSKGYDPVARNCVAALLNASTSPAMTPATILGIARAKAVWSSYATKGYFEPTAGIQWNSAKIVEWMTTTYS
jgi:hypothetical protein